MTTYAVHRIGKTPEADQSSPDQGPFQSRSEAHQFAAAKLPPSTEYKLVRMPPGTIEPDVYRTPDST